MPSTTARDTASAFQKKPAACSEQAWSGRVDVAEISRPGGLLIAALMCCASERGLSQSELANALGVSYWSLSQLRIGFRAIESLDEDLINGCAAFLDIPPLTVQALAGLLTPAEVLENAELTAEDLLYMRQLSRLEPHELVLLPPANRTRPLQAFTVDELTELHQAHADKPTVVTMIRQELACRPYSKTEQLRTAIGPESHLTSESSSTSRPDAAPAPCILSCTRCQKRLRIPHLAEPSEIRCPSCRTEYSVHWQGSVCLVQTLADPNSRTEEDGSDSLNEPTTEREDAWNVLGLEVNSTWEQVERARRSLLQQYHPDRLGHVSPRVRQLAETAFKRVSDAYETLKAQR
jgi:transcriptional regulator with XRE-family HTH domain